MKLKVLFDFYGFLCFWEFVAYRNWIFGIFSWEAITGFYGIFVILSKFYGIFGVYAQGGLLKIFFLNGKLWKFYGLLSLPVYYQNLVDKII